MNVDTCCLELWIAYHLSLDVLYTLFAVATGLMTLLGKWDDAGEDKGPYCDFDPAA